VADVGGSPQDDETGQREQADRKNIRQVLQYEAEPRRNPEEDSGSNSKSGGKSGG
jgi:hypothetical protein